MIFKDVLMQVAYEFNMDLDDLCFVVSTKDLDFPFSFFEFEDDNILGILVTNEEGMEKLHLIVKSEIVYVRIQYLDELENIFEIGNDDYRSVNLYE